MEFQSCSANANHLKLPEIAPNLLPATTILAIFFVASIFVIFISWILSGILTKTRKIERGLICWFSFNGVLYLSVQFYLLLKPEFYKDDTGSIFAEIWKEFSKGDSRYASHYSLVIALQIITVLAGPLCLFTVYAIASDKSYKYVLQLVISVWHCYGFAIYYLTSYLERNELFSGTTPYYFYAYFIGAKSPWAFIPFLLIIRCWRNICASQPTN